MGVDANDIVEFKNSLQNILSKKDAIIAEVSKELASRLLRAVKLRTPVGNGVRVTIERVDGKIVRTETKINGGTLRRGWRADANPQFFGNSCIIRISNNIYYATYVENGHRQTIGRYVPSINKCLKVGWVKGKHMLSLSVDELQKSAPDIIEKRINTWLNGVIK